MSNEDFRRDLNRAFDDLSGSPSSNLSDRVRSAVGDAPRAREPYWIAGVAAAVIAVLIVSVLFVFNPFREPTSSVGGVQTSPTPSPSVTVSPQASPTAVQFICGLQVFQSGTTTTPPPLADASAIRTGTHGTYDRLTVEFGNRLPSQVKVGVASGTNFTLDPSGMQVTLKGKNSILVVIYDADMHTSYSGPVDIVTGYPGLAEARRVGDFEGVVQLGLGVNGPACYRVMWLTNPNRLVIDVQNP